eukprot:TRINITY_DN4439_c0_g1_i2.p1 TRINITY_DN4439_c0_g1~~TRINITY_DN4439_c0_g1_i2.p1  ORF type:complete len:286 (-),score=36.15 TRINITY_DN4439_c0_g1_i2:115-888(-)
MVAWLVHWVAGVGAAISIKLSSSIDDVVWLAPFLTQNISWVTRSRNIAIYVTVCLVQTVLAMCIAYSGDKVVEMLTRNSKDAWSSEKILTVIAGILLVLFAIKLIFCEEADEEETKEDEGEENKYAKVAPSDEGGEAGIVPGRQGSRQLSARNRPIESANGEEAQLAEDTKGPQTLFVMAFVGSLDDLTLFVPMLVGKGFDMIQLIIGSLIASTIIVMICLLAGLCRPVADCLSAIPLPAIVMAFAVMLLTKSFFMT